MPRFTRLAVAALACGAAAIPISASAVVVPVAAVPQPPGVGCVAVKINSGGGGAPWWGAINCNNNLAYNVRGPAPVTTVLALPPGMVREQAYDVDRNGFVVGVAYNGAGVPQPQLWKPNGAPFVPPPYLGNCPPTGIAAGLPQFGWPAGPVVGQAIPGGGGAAGQACWWAPAPAKLIGPVPATTSFAYDVNVNPVYAGQLNGIAAAAVNPAPLAFLPGIGVPSAAYAIDTGNFIVGHEDLGGACPPFAKGDGFEFPFPGGPVIHVGPLPGDCTAGLEDVNDGRAAVGYSFRPGVKQAIGIGLPPPYPAVLFNLNVGVAPHPWAFLSDAAGIADNRFIIATDTGVPNSQVYVLQ